MKTKLLKQKKEMITSLFALLLCIAGTANVFAQQVHDNLQNLKQYKGSFEMPGFGYSYYKNETSEKHSIKKEGVAQYNYREREDFTRSFEGDFYFAIDEEWLSLLMQDNKVLSILKNITDFSSDEIMKVVAIMAPFAMGQFKNDKQVGKWIWAYWEEGLETFIYKEVSFDEDGKPQGFAKQYRYVIDFGEFWHDEGYRNNKSIYKPRGWMIGEVVDNVIVSGDYKLGFGEASEDMKYAKTQRLFGDHSYHYEVSGGYNFKGPVGKWTVSGDYFENNGKYTIVEFDNNGNCIANYWIDQSTGDKKYPQYSNNRNNPIQYIKQTQSSIYYMINTSCFRASKMLE